MMTIEQLHQWIESGPVCCADELTVLAERQIAALRATLAEVAPTLETAQAVQRKPRKPRVKRQPMPAAVAAPAEPTAPAPGSGATVGLAEAVRRLLADLPRRAYTLASLARAVGADRSDVAAVLRQYQRAGTAVCTGRGPGAVWCGPAREEPPSQPRAVPLPPTDEPERGDAAEWTEVSP